MKYGLNEPNEPMHAANNSVNSNHKNARVLDDLVNPVHSIQNKPAVMNRSELLVCPDDNDTALGVLSLSKGRLEIFYNFDQTIGCVSKCN